MPKQSKKVQRAKSEMTQNNQKKLTKTYLLITETTPLIQGPDVGHTKHNQARMAQEPGVSMVTKPMMMISKLSQQM